MKERFIGYRRSVVVGWGAVVVCVSGLVGCGGGGSAGVDGPCEPPAGVRTVLVYPAPGATGIPDDFGLVVLGSTAALSPSYEAHVVNSTGQDSVLFDQLSAAPTPLPEPYAVPSFAAPVYEASVNPGTTFAAGTRVTVYLNEQLSSGYCFATLDLGSFTVR